MNIILLQKPNIENKLLYTFYSLSKVDFTFRIAHDMCIFLSIAFQKLVNNILNVFRKLWLPHPLLSDHPFVFNNGLVLEQYSVTESSLLWCFWWNRLIHHFFSQSSTSQFRLNAKNSIWILYSNLIQFLIYVYQYLNSIPLMFVVSLGWAFVCDYELELWPPCRYHIDSGLS
jgi:hypothetical protein